MPHHQIDIVLSWANEINGLVFLDVQVGHSTLQVELPTLVKYLQLPQVHLGIDPEFSMKNKSPPGTKIGTYSAEDINYTLLDYGTKMPFRYSDPNISNSLLSFLRQKTKRILNSPFEEKL